MQINGTIEEILDLVTTTSGFRSRKIAVKTDEQYPQILPIEFLQANVDKIDSLQVGQQVKVSINLRGDIYNEKRFVKLQGWKVE